MEQIGSMASKFALTLPDGHATPPTVQLQSPVTTTPTSRSINPLSSKVTSVLSTPCADSDFREALAILDDRGLENSAATRRQLRLDMQKEVIDSNGEIISEFGNVAEQLRRIGKVMTALNDSYSHMKQQVDKAHHATRSVMSEASSLMAQKDEIEKRQRLLQAFLSNFCLSAAETSALGLMSEPVDDDFFAALSKAKKISKDCEVLLGFENQVLGLEIVEQTCKHLNVGYQKLYRWVQKEFKTVNLENPRIGSAIRRALRVLAERPSLFQACLDHFAEAREQVLSDSFLTALTGRNGGGSEDCSIKPIELVAHDPLRYVGDMLAWSHSATVGEKEALEILFISEGDEIAREIQAGRDNEVWRLVDDGEPVSSFDAVTALNELVDRDMAGAGRILRQRIGQVIQTNEDTILAYKLANLLNFYKATFAKLLCVEAGTVDLLSNLETEALRQFRSLMRDHIATLQADFQHTPADLGPPEFLQHSLQQLSAIMTSCETSLTSSPDREADFQPILVEALDPFMSGCVNMARTIEPPSDSIFLINCLQAAQRGLAVFAFARRRAAELGSQVEWQSHILTQSQYLFFRMESGLHALIDALASLKTDSEGVAKVRGLDAARGEALAQASLTLDDFLPSALMDAMENLNHLQDSKLAREITEKAVDRFCTDYEHVEEMLMLADELTDEPHIDDPADVQSLRALFPRTSGEIRVLLS